MSHMFSLGALLSLVITSMTFADATDTRSLLSGPSVWQSIASDGVKIFAVPETGKSGKPALRIDFDFAAGAGYGGVFLDLPLDLPENFELVLSLHGEGPANNLELKLVDPEGLNVWWVNRRAFEWPLQPARLISQRRHFQFAWGPSGGATLRKLGRIELIIAAVEGGKGTIWIDDFTFSPRPPVRPYSGTPVVSASSGAADSLQQLLKDDKSTWLADKDDQTPALSVDFGQSREIGGLVVHWLGGHAPADFDIQTSNDGNEWSTIRKVRGVTGLHSAIALPELQTQRLRLALSRRGASPGVSRLQFLESTDGATPNAFWKIRAARASRGIFPRNLLNEQSFWTVIGQPGDDCEAIINEEGQVEVDRGSFSIEPFLVCDGKLLTWADATHEQSLQNGYLPIPTVIRKHKGIALTVTAMAAGDAGKSRLHAAYTVRNTSTSATRGTLALAIRPLQVLPPWQDLNITGGWTPIRSIHPESDGFVVNGKKRVVASIGFRSSATHFDAGDPIEMLASGHQPKESSADCLEKSASGLLEWKFALEPGASQTFLVCVPFHGIDVPSNLPNDGDSFDALASKVAADWDAQINRATFQLPPAARQFSDTIRATQAYILINHDGSGFQPGSRTYDRSWMRDGSMTSAAMLEFGHDSLVRKFIEWYAPYQFPSGKVPCVVDRRGPDPVAEHDSHGQFIWLVANYYRYTGEEEFVRQQFPRVKLAVEYIESLRAQRMTDEFSALGSSRQESNKPPVSALAFRGLVPESISHEGYSAKPMHSFWDQLYVLRGLNDAAYLAQVVGDAELTSRWRKLSGDFRDSVINSMRFTQQAHGIDYLPGCVELGDFDSTSSTILLWPVDEASHFPRAWIDATFNRYWREFLKRRDTVPAIWEAYTPYELRHVGAYVRLGQKDRAWATLNFFFSCQRPIGWRHWAEVVWRDRNTPKMIGDMPHTWCGSDFLNAVRAMFVYEDESSRRLILFAGLPDEWCADPKGVGFKSLRTEYGVVSASVIPDGANHLRVTVNCSALPPGGIEVRSPINRRIKSATVNGNEVTLGVENSVRVNSREAVMDLYY